MTSRIVDGFRANASKLDEIKKRFAELQMLGTKHEEVMMKVIRYYNIIFKNISSRRKEIKLKGLKEIYVVTKAGLGRKNDWQINSINLTSIPKVDFLNELRLLALPENKKQFKKALSKEKYKIFSNFLKKSKLLEIKNVFELKTKKKLKDYKIKNDLELTKVSLKYNLIELEVDIGRPMQIPLYNLNLEYVSFLEQVSPETIKLLRRALKNRQKEIDNLNKFIEYLRTKFENQIVLEELYSKPRSAIFKA